MVSGSHRLVYKWFQENSPSRGSRSAQMRRLLQKQPYVRDLHRPGEDAERIERFMMHVAAPNDAAEPRFMVSGGVTTDMWGWRPELSRR